MESKGRATRESVLKRCNDISLAVPIDRLCSYSSGPRRIYNGRRLVPTSQHSIVEVLLCGVALTGLR